jgi:hypothetical protein
MLAEPPCHESALRGLIASEYLVTGTEAQDWTPAGFAVWGDLLTSAEKPSLLHQAFQAGRIPAADLAKLIAFAWIRDDQPTQDTGDQPWLEMFAAAGYFSDPQPRPRPSRPVTLYRGATAARMHGMSWAETPQVATELGIRHARHDAAALYETTAGPEAILAYLHKPGEGWTVVVDPTRLADIRHIEEIPVPPPRWL